ncbi:autolysin [Macrococcus hajekii]|uniref:Autolysin n=1 Tax=Macrococcus hajekii TaxID=198482 RepID=A0A4R6BLE8_9STAP|nr:N-acetylglucosaminidase [Macrococcus hajekii]TDM02614.1 autolysin [Macrococcus hajekii]GGB02478.1 autolysin [Macrococcus hajekii]
MATKRTSIKRLELRNKLILIGILLLIGFAIYLLIQISRTAMEEKFKDQRVTVQYTYKEALKRQMNADAVASDGTSWHDATLKDVERYLNPDSFYHHAEQKYQFLNLRKSQNISADKLNLLLKGKGILENQGQAFHDAAREADVNEIYLISHALLETGKGRSELAKGIKVNGKGKIDSQGTPYYNFYGVGAYDHAPVAEGARYAQQQNWDTPEKAIQGGAQFIADEYLSRENQYTLYTMRFNPVDPGRHQYATDVMWAHHNARQMAQYYRQLGIEGQFFTRHYYKK